MSLESALCDFMRSNSEIYSKLIRLINVLIYILYINCHCTICDIKNEIDSINLENIRPGFVLRTIIRPKTINYRTGEKSRILKEFLRERT